MTKTIPTEIIARFYGLHLGAKCQTEYGMLALTEIDTCNHDYPVWFSRLHEFNKDNIELRGHYSKGSTYKNAPLLLTPLIKITDEHSVEVDKICSHPDYASTPKFHTVTRGKVRLRDIFEQELQVSRSYVVIDYLRSLHYALPFTTVHNGKPYTLTVQDMVDNGLIQLT